MLASEELKLSVFILCMFILLKIQSPRKEGDVDSGGVGVSAELYHSLFASLCVINGKVSSVKKKNSVGEKSLTPRCFSSSVLIPKDRDCLKGYKEI